MKIFKQVLFGLAVALCFFPFMTSPWALFLGIALGTIIGVPFQTSIVKKAQTYLLQGSIVALGAGMNFVQVLRVGAHNIPSTLTGLILTIIVGVFLFKRFGLSKNLGLLLSAGTAICGGSAIAAVSPVVKATDRETSLALGVVFLLNSVALILFPPLGHWLGLNEQAFGMFAALAIHDTSSVVGAASQYGGEALQIGTTTKLVRALWIMPLTLGIVYFNRKSGDKTARFPVFILLFLLMSILTTWVSLPVIYDVGKRGLVAAIFIIGTGFQIQTLRTLGWKVIISSLLLWLFSIVLALVQVRVW